MASGVLVYSGLVTKTKAMHGKLLTPQELAALTEYESVEEFISFLREHSGYAPVFAGRDEVEHRGQVEAVIGEALYRDYGRLYRFAGAGQRKVLEMAFLRYELADAEKPGEGYTDEISADGDMKLDVDYYRMLWKYREKIKDRRTRDICAQIWGTEIDWQNIMWMYRAKRFYGSTAAEIERELIPVSYKLRKGELQSLLLAEHLEEFIDLVGKTAYFTEKDAVVKLGDEITYRAVLNRTYRRVCRKYPMSIAPVLQYFYDKEHEIDMLTTILEGVRYQIPAKEIQELVLVTA